VKHKGGGGQSEIIELYRLWLPVRPYLSRQVGELYGRNDGNVLEIGPFSGLTFELAAANIGASFCMAAFPREIVEPLREEAGSLGMADRVAIVESDPELSRVPEGAFDLALFRGAFFFPSFFTPDLQAVYRSLRAGGMAFIGGGFGSYTPEEVIGRIKERSKELNLCLGRIHLSEKELRAAAHSAALAEKATIITDGGLWMVLRKEKDAG